LSIKDKTLTPDERAAFPSYDGDDRPKPEFQRAAVMIFHDVPTPVVRAERPTPALDFSIQPLSNAGPAFLSLINDRDDRSTDTLFEVFSETEDRDSVYAVRSLFRRLDKLDAVDYLDRHQFILDKHGISSVS
jgi:hypothetical protein